MMTAYESSTVFAERPSPLAPTLLQPIDHRIEIQQADSQDICRAANGLVNRMYRWKGYACGRDVDVDPCLTSFVARQAQDGATLGTISVRYDSEDGLSVDKLFATQSNGLRRQGRRLCEMTKFAVEPGQHSKRLLVRLFCAAFSHAYKVKQVDDLLIEVNPAHVGFYLRQLDFELFGEEKWNDRVKAPSILLRLRLEHAAAQIRRCIAQSRENKSNSLYFRVDSDLLSGAMGEVGNGRKYGTTCQSSIEA